MSAIFYHRYALTSAGALNAASARTTHEGALIRVGSGYGCLHPWPDLGDDAIEEQLQTLAQGGRSPLIDGALRCAAADGEARIAGRSLFEEAVPESHWLALPGDEPLAVKKLGFDTVKLKFGRDIGPELEMMSSWSDAGFRLRLDCNETLSLSTFLEFWEDLGEMKKSVQLIEDPVKWDPESWRVLREIEVPVAVDRDAEERFHPGEIAVIKPATSNWLPPGDARFLVTSYMDHAIGQFWAAVEAARLAKEEGNRFLGAGLLTHRCFETDEFFDQIQTDGPRLLSPGGTGLGFDELLEALPWKPLN